MKAYKIVPDLGLRDYDWLFRFRGRTILNNVVILKNHKHPTIKIPGSSSEYFLHLINRAPVFECQTLFLDGCTNDFIATWLNEKSFPLVRQLYIKTRSYSYDPFPLIKRDINGDIVSKFEKIYLCNVSSDHKNKLAYNQNNLLRRINGIENISPSDYQYMINQYDTSENICLYDTGNKHLPKE